MDMVKDIYEVCTGCHLMTTNKGSVCQHWISLMGGKKDLVSIKY
jgi:hypothetical protein